MKLYCLSGNPNRPCFVVKFKHTTIMLDCSLDPVSMLNFLPLPPTNSGKFCNVAGWTPASLPTGIKQHDVMELKDLEGKIFVDSEPEFALPEFGLLDMSEVDALLLSNYHCMMALPFLMECTSFRGAVYATEPTLNMGRLLMQEMVEYVSCSPKPGQASRWKQPNVLSFLPAPLRDAINPLTWKQLYTKQKITDSMSKVKTVGFNEKFDIFGQLEVCAVSSGFCLGSANWVLKSHYEKIAYISGSSTLTTHPKPMEQALLRHADVAVISRLTQTPTANPDGMIGEFCINTAMTLRNGGNVLVPVYPVGVTYDLFECVSRHLDTCGLERIPLYFISPIADSSLAYSNIYAEWLSNDKQSKVYLPEPPFPHAELVNGNRLFHYPNLQSIKELKVPCVMFTGHPSLRMGEVVHFLELWGKSSANTLIITEPDFPYLEALAPYHPLPMKVCYCPIDTSLSFPQANKLLRDLKPQHLVMPEQYGQPPLLQPHNKALILEYESVPMPYRRGEVLSLPVKRSYEKVDMDALLASTLVPTEVRPGIAIASVTGELVAKDNKYILKKATARDDSNGGVALKPTKYVWGSLDVQQFAQELTKQGVTDVKVEETGVSHIVHLPTEDSLIQIDSGSTHIICEGNEELRIKIRDTLLKCLDTF